MKHSLKITNILLIIFILAQLLGVAIIYNYIDTEKSTEGKLVFEELPFVERPPLEEKTSFIFLIIAVLIGTGLLLLLIKFNLLLVWRLWFLMAVVIALVIAFTAFFDVTLFMLSSFPVTLQLLLALVFGAWKVFKPNFWVQNSTELFIYGGLAAIFVPVLNLFSVSILLLLISGYDAYAVWKSKHMITLAKSQTKAKIFAGLLIPYKLGKKVPKGKKVKKVSVRTAILGGGDIGFPLIFAGVILKEMGLWQSLVIPFFAALGLGVLLYKSEQKKFYPAMPFISAGCFLGLLVVWLLTKFLV